MECAVRVAHRATLQIGGFAPEEIELAGSGRCFLQGRRERQFISEFLREALGRFRRQALVMIVHEGPNAAHFLQVSLDLQGPAFQRGLALPEQFSISMHARAIPSIFRGVVAHEPHVEEVSCVRPKFERSQVPFVQWTGVGPGPAHAMFFEQPDDLGPMPASVTELDREAKFARQLREKIAQGRFAFLGREGRRQLNQNDLQLGRERFHGSEESGKVRTAVAQPAGVSDGSRELAAETKRRWRGFHPPQNNRLARHVVKSGIDFDRGEVARVKLQPAIRRQIRGIKAPAPFFEAPGTRAEPDLLLIV